MGYLNVWHVRDLYRHEIFISCWQILRSLQLVDGLQEWHSVLQDFFLEVRIENSVTMVTVHHYEACWVMPNSYPEWRNFHFTPNNHYRFFFLHTLPSTIVFKLACELFYQFYAKISMFDQEKFGSVPVYDVVHMAVLHLLRQNGWNSRKTLSGMQETQFLLCWLLT